MLSFSCHNQKDYADILKGVQQKEGGEGEEEEEKEEKGKKEKRTRFLIS